MVWFGPTVREIALSQSLPTPITSELLLVVTREAAGAPGLAFPEPIAPMAPEPPVPLVFTPVKLSTGNRRAHILRQSRSHRNSG